MLRDFLLFRLSGPLASWGEIAVGERRSSWPRPSKSSVLGLVAAALGYDRQDASAHASLSEGLHFAVRVDVAGAARNGLGGGSTLTPLRDYHTAQVPSGRASKQWANRAAELSEDKLNTILSERWYWTNMMATAALWPKDGDKEAPSLAEIEGALREPIFTLYLGRKSCPPSRPLSPEILSAESIGAAFSTYDVQDAAKTAQAIVQNGGARREAILCALTVQTGRDIWADLEATAESERAPEEAPEAVDAAIPREEASGDDGHRN